jgi:hypothetical protein
LALGTVSAQSDFVIGGSEPESVGQLVDGPFEGRVFEGDELAALVAHEVMVVLLSRGVGRLVPGDPVPEFEAVDEVVGVQELEHPVDTGSPDGPLPAPGAAHGVFDLNRAQCAVLSGEQVDDPVARRAAMMSRAPEHAARMLSPARG